MIQCASRNVDTVLAVILWLLSGIMIMFEGLFDTTHSRQMNRRRSHGYLNVAYNIIHALNSMVV